MNYTFNGTKRTYDKKSIVYLLGNFIIENVSFFKAFCDIFYSVRTPQKKCLIEHIIEREKKVALKNISDEKISEFDTLILQFIEEHFNDNGRVRGRIIEFILYNIGPLQSFDADHFNVFADCYIKDQNGDLIGGAKNFDIGFHCDANCLFELEAELIESKADINNFLLKNPSKPSPLEFDSKAEEKLDYMVKVLQILSESKKLVVALATLKYDICQTEVLMNKLGYQSSIQIYHYNHIRDALLSNNLA
jgi:hypothetical protein